MTRRSWIILLLLLAALLFGAGIYLPKIVNGQNNTTRSSASNASQIIRQQGDLKLVFEHTGSMSQSYMLIGIALYNSAEIKKRANNAHVAGIPLAKAKELLRQYPSMRRCGAPDSEEAMRAVHNLPLLTDSSAIKRTVQETKDRFDSASRQGDEPICLRVSGSVFKLEKMYAGNETIEMGDDSMELIQPTELEMVPCI